MNLLASVRLSDADPAYPVFEINHPTCSARVALHGAQVMSWRPVDEEEVLYLSTDGVFREGKAIRGGIPVCWPWFNAHPANASQPSHGLVRGRFWELLDASEDGSGVTMRFGTGIGIWFSTGRWTASTRVPVAYSWWRNEARRPQAFGSVTNAGGWMMMRASGLSKR